MYFMHVEIHFINVCQRLSVRIPTMNSKVTGPVSRLPGRAVHEQFLSVSSIISLC